eukprot:jgi/Mesen1/2620/ME000166S01745
MATRGKQSGHDTAKMQQKMEMEPLSKVLDGTVIPGEKPFSIHEEVQSKGGVDLLAPGPGEKSLIRIYLDESLEKAFNCAINVHLQAFYQYQALSNFCFKDNVSLPGMGKYFFKRSMAFLKNYKDLAEFASSRGGQVMLRDIQAPHQQFFDSTNGEALAVMEYDLAASKVVYEKQLQLHKAAEKVGDAGARNCIENKLLMHMVPSLARIGMYVSQLRRVGANGPGVYVIDRDILLGLDAGELTFGQVTDPRADEMAAPMVPPSKRMRDSVCRSSLWGQMMEQMS